MKYSIVILSLLLLGSCISEVENKITRTADYEAFLLSKPTKTNSKYFELWNSKIRPDSMQLMSFGIVAGQYENYFNATGDITYLKKAERALKKAVDIAAIGKAGYARALARNYIGQHRFREALQQAENALELGSGLNETHSLLFDIHMELGNYEKAEPYLDRIEDLSNFGYLIRVAKWNDHKGDLDTTIRFMEKAMHKAENSKNTSLLVWSYTNLADYYGHAGRITDSYRYYLKSLEIDPQNAYAKKGIAWIVFSHEKDPEEALRILDTVTEQYLAPDYYLLKVEIADYMNDDEKKYTNLDIYFNLVENPAYGNMYNTYTIGLFLEEDTEHYDKAIVYAKKEIENRPTPESYSWLAYSYLKKGEKEAAAKIVKTHIDGKTYEPAILYRMAEIYKAIGVPHKVEELKEELLEATYELGPSMTDKIAML